MWKEYFNIIKVVPGKIVVPKIGTVDFSSNNVSTALCKTLFDSNFPYLELTEKGKEFFYGDTSPKKTPSKTNKKKSTK